MSDTIAYKIDNNLYINLTNECSNNCDFCVRNHMDLYEGYNLWLTKEPTVDEVIAAIGDASQYGEIVFCGFGEPFYRFTSMVAVAQYLKAHFNVKTRINTNGQAMLIVGENVIPSLEGCIDTINISLNETSAEEYDKLCHSVFGESAYYSLLDFARECVGHIPNVVLSVVDILGEEKLEKAKKIAKDIGVQLRIREYIE